MKRIVKITLFLSLGLVLLSSFPPPTLAAGRVDLNFEGRMMSAEIGGAPLGHVIEEMKRETGIWFRLWFDKSSSLLDKKISIRFKDLPIREGIERLFSKLNYSLVFGPNKKLLGVFLMGEKTGGSRYRRYTNPRRIPTRTPRRIPRRVNRR